MSGNIPLEIQMEIIQRIPDIKSVVQLRSVSKAWKSTIDSKKFVTGHTRRHIQQQRRHLLIRGKDSGDPHKEVKYVSIVDDDTFPHQKFNLSVPDFCKDVRIVGSSHGLFCFHDFKRNIVIWNPSIENFVLMVVPYEVSIWTHDFFFGVCHNTLDPKIVKIAKNGNPSTRVEVFSLSAGAWRSPLINTCPRESIVLGRSQAVVDGFIYFSAYDDTINVGLVRVYPKFIMSFDLTSEEFTELYLPITPQDHLRVSNLRESLGVFEFPFDRHPENVIIWIMKGRGCTRIFEKLYHISLSDVSIGFIRGFRTSGAPIVEIGKALPTLAAYEPESKDVTEIWRDGTRGTFSVHSYKETLLLLGL